MNGLMSNKDKYKQAFSAFQPSDEAVEKIYKMTVDNKVKSNVWLKRVCACVIVFALVISGGFGANYAVQKNVANNDLGVIVAYASGDSFRVGSNNEQQLFYSIYVMPNDNNELSDKVNKRWNEDASSVDDNAESLGKDGYGASVGKGSSGLINYDTGQETGTIKTIHAGNLALSLDDYSEVKAFTVENTSPYGLLQFDYLDGFERLYGEEVDASSLSEEEQRQFFLLDHKFIITGDELRRSKDSGMYSCGINHIVNKGYFLNWEMSDELEYAIGKDPYFDLSQIKDTIKFTAEFNDGTVKSASINLYFDSNGYMHFEPAE